MSQKWIIDYLETMDMQRGEQEPNVMLIWNSNNPSIRMYGRAASYHPDDYPKALREFLRQDMEFRKWIMNHLNVEDTVIFTDIEDVFTMKQIINL